MMKSSTCALGHYHDVISISRTIRWHLFSYISLFCSPVKEKGKQGRMKRLIMVQWINLNWNNRSVLRSTSIFCIGRQNWPYPPTTSGSYSRQGGREGGRPADKTQVGFKIFKIFYRLNYLGFYFAAMLLQ